MTKNKTASGSRGVLHFCPVYSAAGAKKIHRLSREGGGYTNYLISFRLDICPAGQWYILNSIWPLDNPDSVGLGAAFGQLPSPNHLPAAVSPVVFYECIGVRCEPIMTRTGANENNHNE